jgi:hypothetical protein
MILVRGGGMRAVQRCVAAMLLVAALGGVTVRAQTREPASIAELRGEWERAGAGFGCKVAIPEKLRVVAIEAVLSRACQHMGPLVVGDGVKAVTAALGKPSRKLPQPKGQIAWVYFLAQQDSYPYLIVTLREDKVVALQLTGRSAAKGYGFNHIDLGMPAETLLQQFGQPGHIESSEEQGSELWSYRPWPFSFEVNGGRISSIRIAKP